MQKTVFFKFGSNIDKKYRNPIETFGYRNQRLKMRFHFLFSSLFLFGFVRNQFFDFKFVNPLKHKKLSDSSIVLKEYNSIVESQCAINCAANTKCGSVNYHKETQTCILNGRPLKKENLKNLLTDADGWTFFEKSEVRKKLNYPQAFNARSSYTNFLSHSHYLYKPNLETQISRLT